MINLGQILLSISLALAAIQFFAGVFKFNFSQVKLTKILFFSLLVCFGFLISRYIISDFSYLNVFENSHSMKPLFYRIAGVWGNHEGSMLLFILALGFYGAVFASFSKSENKEEILFFQGVVSFLLLFYIYFFSSPFEVNPYVLKGIDVKQGLGLNPLLQDFGLAIHPPILYLGYAGFSLAFSSALVALKDNVDPQKFAEEIRNYVLVSWAFLGLGIGLGSWWAYRELGWGGFWFWDPVENSSLVPWLIGSALLHSSIYTRKFGGYALLTIFLSLAAFLLSLVGFFLVRSGVLSSVHSFASDPNRGLVMLAIVSILSSYAFYLFGKNIFNYNKPLRYKYTVFSRQVHLGFNVVLFMSLATTILLGLFYPIILEVLDINSISVGEPYFERTFVPLSVLLSLVAVFTPFVKWHKNKISKFGKLIPSFLTSVIITFILRNYFPQISLLASVCVFSGLWLFVSMLELFVLRLFDSNNKVTRGLLVLFLSHGGFGLLIIFITLVVSLETSDEAIISKSQPFEKDGLKIELEHSKISKNGNYLYHRAEFKVSQGKNNYYLKPENRIYFPDAKKTYEVDIVTDYFADHYMVMGASEAAESGEYQFPVRFYTKPFILYMWLAMVMISLGGFVALIPKRGKIGK